MKITYQDQKTNPHKLLVLTSYFASLPREEQFGENHKYTNQKNVTRMEET